MQIYQIKNGQVGSSPVLDQPAPVNRTLDFPDGVSYKVVASMPQFLTNDQTVIEKEPKDRTHYPITLTRYLKNVPYIGYVPHMGEGVWVLVPDRGSVEGYVLEKDYLNEKLHHIQNLTRITNNDERPMVENHELVDIRNCVMSPTADVLVYQKVIERVLDESEHTTPKDEKMAETLSQIASSARVSMEEIVRDNPGLPTDAPLKPETHVILRHRELTTQIWKQVIDKPIVTPISPNDVSAMFPSFSFNGDSVLFASDNTSPNALLWRMQVDTGGTRMIRITSSDSLDYDPSGGQEFVAYTSIPRRAKSPEVWLTRPDGREPSLVTDGESPQISPSGDKIAFIKLWTAPGGQSAVRQLWVMNVNGGEATQLTQNRDFEVIDPKWSPDGKWIVYASNEGKDARRAELRHLAHDRRRPPQDATHQRRLPRLQPLLRPYRQIHLLPLQPRRILERLALRTHPRSPHRHGRPGRRPITFCPSVPLVSPSPRPPSSVPSSPRPEEGRRVRAFPTNVPNVPKCPIFRDVVTR